MKREEKKWLEKAPVETRSLPTFTHCFPRSQAAAGSLLPTRSIRRNCFRFEEVVLAKSASTE
ncbi:MAG: hypothetical protein DME20_07295 [Verrucomicrobia bacterium]|nr:MAG: hypothetical protein DME92_07455 [Verrucomicrobiota bacterium]PYK49270.1 MAG: hypothetical protein DME20_07295 [Verrucomicrobiota bacterium]